MAAKTAKHVDDLQTRLIDQFQHFLRAWQPDESAVPAPPPSADLPALVNAARADLDAAIRQREEILRHADLRIARGKQRLAALEAELKRIQKQAATAPTESETVRTPAKPKGKHKWERGKQTST